MGTVLCICILRRTTLPPWKVSRFFSSRYSEKSLGAVWGCRRCFDMLYDLFPVANMPRLEPRIAYQYFHLLGSTQVQILDDGRALTSDRGNRRRAALEE